MKPLFKNILLFVAVFSLGTILRSTITEYFNPKPSFTLSESTTKDFGTVKQSQPVKHFFKFKNTGGIPLKIENVETNCGCTASIWPKKPIEPNASDSILIEYDSNIKGSFNRKAIVHIQNTAETKTLFIKGIITD